ncbi:type II secretion system F family protein [Pseudooceanicola atlanticus]|uniref:Pilus assembly protein TadC n=1 Tax=Pseudooceanicola atlanticus TaxID=1461694 RepID=A0A0A0EGP0_9RHOB|nr:type II secretion system F family protein [Pseudooceanicola atlanticus]KGM49475.1 pilus assembly protein TadC [Pseudooceanicola atlanticus]
MEAINSLLVGALGPLGPLMVVGGLGLLLILVTLPFLITKKEDPLEKLKRSNAEQSRGDAKHDRLRNAKSNKKLERYSSFLEPQNEAEYSAMRQKMLQAGYRSKDAVRYFHFAQFSLGILGLIVGVVYFLLFLAADDPDMQKTLMYTMGPGIIGYMFPKYWINKRMETRKEEIVNGFPDALDMLLVCVEAGQSMDQAILRVAGEIRTSYPSLADEFEIVSHEIKAGKDKPTVLSEMAERCGVPDIASFVTVLVQSATFGTSVADALRVYAAEMRDKRVMRAEEKANKLPTKMTLATMMLTVPPLLIILIGPSLLGISKMGEMSAQQTQEEARK